MVNNIVLCYVYEPGKIVFVTPRSMQQYTVAASHDYNSRVEADKTIEIVLTLTGFLSYENLCIHT